MFGFSRLNPQFKMRSVRDLIIPPSHDLERVRAARVIAKVWLRFKKRRACAIAIIVRWWKCFQLRKRIVKSKRYRAYEIIARTWTTNRLRRKFREMMRVVIYCIENMSAHILGKYVRGYIVRRRYVHLRSSILFIQRKWRERSKKKTFNTKFYILYKKSITKHRRRMARRKPSEIIRRYFYAWYDVGRHRKQEVLRTPVKNLSHRRFRDMMRVSIHLQVLDLRAARFFCYFSKSTCHFFLDEYMFDVTTFLKMLQVVLNHTMMNATWSSFLKITLPMLSKINDSQVLQNMALLKVKENDIRISRARVIFATLVKTFIRFHARCMHMFYYAKDIFGNDIDADICMRVLLRRAYATSNTNQHKEHVDIRHQWYTQKDTFVPMFAIDLDYPSQCQVINEMWFSTCRKPDEDIFSIFDDLRFT